MPTSPTRFRIFENPDSASACVASEIARLIRERATLGRRVVLGFTPGSTPLPLFEELIYLHQEEGLSFSNVVTFNSVEYLGLETGNPHTFRSSMERNLFDHLDVPAGNQHFLRSDIPAASHTSHCAAYEKEITAAGGIDIQLLGIGRNGHIGFNEPGSAEDSRTRRVILSEAIREDAAATLDGIAKVSAALTIGCGTILEARRIVLMAWGARKARIIRRAIAGPLTPKLPASFLQSHSSAQIFLDSPAAALVKELR